MWEKLCFSTDFSITHRSKNYHWSLPPDKIKKMPAQCRGISKNINKILSSLFNIGTLMLTLLETHWFPLAIIKWIIILSRYGRSGTQFKTQVVKEALRTCYRYKLQLKTIHQKEASSKTEEQISNVSLLVEYGSIQV